MIPCSFDESNLVLGAPEGYTPEEIEALSVFVGYSPSHQSPLTISCWKLTQGELDKIKRTGRIWLHVMGPTMMPCFLTAAKPTMIPKEE